MNLDFLEALDALERERHMPKEKLIEAIESALVSAYKKNYGDNYRKIRVNIDNSTGDINVFMGKDVVEEVEDVYSQISLEEAQEVDPEYEIGKAIVFNDETLKDEDEVRYVPIYMCMFLERDVLPEKLIYDIGAPV